VSRALPIATDAREAALLRALDAMRERLRALVLRHAVAQGRQRREVARLAGELERAGFNGAYTFEGQSDPFVSLAAAAMSTERMALMTAIAVAFARNPMNLAYLGNDLQTLSKGRFILGLGTQVKAHIDAAVRCGSIASRCARASSAAYCGISLRRCQSNQRSSASRKGGVCSPLAST